MSRKLILTATVLAIQSYAFGDMTVSIDMVDPGDGVPLPPTGTVVADLFADFGYCDEYPDHPGFLCVGWLYGMALNGAELLYKSDAVGDDPEDVLSPGIAEKFVTFVSLPYGRDAAARFSFAGRPGTCWCEPPTPEYSCASASGVGVIWANTGFYEGNTGYVTRVAIDISLTGFDDDDVILCLTADAPHGAVPLFRSEWGGGGGGTGCYSICPAEQEGINWGFYAFTCLGDLDYDGDVDLADLAQLLAHYGMTSGAIHTDGDLDGDGDVDLADLAELLGQYGNDCD